MPLAAGTQLGPYEVLALLGAGGMGEIYRARDTVLLREVAVKVLPRSATVPESAQGLLSEARSAAALNHPHIATIHGVGEADGQTYIAMELICGEDLGAKLRTERLLPARALDLALQAAEALAAAHDREIIHRDLKPSNFMVTDTGQVKLIDFGLARVARRQPGTAGESGSTETSPDAVAGTLAYMSPEQVRGGRVDARTDVWSFGALLYEMIAGRPAFGRTTGADTIGAILRDPAPRLRMPSPPIGLPALAEIQRVIDRCLAKDRTERYSSARELLADLGVARRLLGNESSGARPRTTEAAELTPGMRRTVTAVVVGIGDVRGLDPEARRQRSERTRQRVTPALERHGALCERLHDGRILGLFGVPVAHEDDSLRAVRAASEIAEAQGGEGAALGIGIDTGEVLTGDVSAGEPLVSGDAVDGAARLERLCGSGVVLGEATRRLVRDAVAVDPLESSGGTEPAFRLRELAAEATLISRRLDTPLVGRDLELAQLQQAFERAVREGRSQLVTVFGVAGIGKTKLAAELGACLQGRARVLTGHCLSYGEAITYWPIREIVEHGLRGRSLRDVLGAGEELAARRIESALGAGTTGAIRDETFWAVRKLVEALGSRDPLVLVFEDIHWAEPTLLDLIEHLTESVRRTPLLVVCLARPELLEARPGWGGGKLNAVSVLLQALSGADSSKLMHRLPASAQMPPRALARIADLSGGNPLFLEQMLAMVAEQGGAAEEISVPPAIQALLSARLDGLTGVERRLLECASVQGEVFHLGGLVALSDGVSAGEATDVLLGLERKDLVEAEHGVVPGEEAYRFRHALIRDAAYDRLAKGTRSVMHERFAGWLDQMAGGRAAEFEDIVGYHLEQAHRFSAELDSADERALRLAAAARERLDSAGRHAFRRGDVPAAAQHMERVRSHEGPAPQAWLALAPDVGFGLFQAGELEQAERLLDDALVRSHDAGLRPPELSAWLVRELVRLYNQPERVDLPATRRRTEGLLPGFAETGNDLSSTRAWTLLWHIYQCTRDAASLRHAAERGLEYARKAGSRLDEAWSLSLLGWSLVDGPTPVREGAEVCESLLRHVRHDPLVETVISSFAAHVAAMDGRLPDARALILKSRAGLRELGTGTLRSIIEVEVMCSRVEDLGGDTAAMEQAARSAVRHSDEMGDRWFQVLAMIDLAQALCYQGQAGEALQVLDESDELPSPPDVYIEIKRPAVRALAFAGLGRLDAADAIAKQAVALAEGTLFLGLFAEALLTLATVERKRGFALEASEAAGRALVLLERKGDVVSAARARALR